MGMILFWIKNPRHALTWSLAPFFLLHVLIGHKETRFLFPIMHAAPVCLMLLLLTPLKGKALGEWIYEKTSLRWLSKGVVYLNAVALISLSVVPASPTIRFYKAVYDRSIHELRYLPGEDPYSVLGIPLYFYRAPDLKLIELQTPLPQESFWLASRTAELKPELRQRCQAVSHALPNIAALARLRNWTLFECQPASGS
jgi:phosphatidylinositol glycan class B